MSVLAEGRTGSCANKGKT